MNKENMSAISQFQKNIYEKSLNYVKCLNLFELTSKKHSLRCYLYNVVNFNCCMLDILNKENLFYYLVVFLTTCTKLLN